MNHPSSSGSLADSLLPRGGGVGWRGIVLVLTFFQFQTAWAMLPVVDVAEISHVMEEVSVLKKSYESLQDQAKTLQSQYDAITGNYKWGNWQNDADSIKQQFEWAPSNWKTALNNLAGGNSARYQELLNQYQNNHPVLSQDAYSKGADENLSGEYQNQVATTQASSATASGEFNDINTHLDELQKLGSEIENSKTNITLKSAVDLNSRIELEVAYISMEELRMQAVLNQQTSEISASKIAEASEASQFNQAGE